MSINHPDPITGPWSEIAFIQGDDYAAVADMRTGELASHLLDIGGYADTVRVFPVGPWGSSDTVTEVTVNGTVYVLSVNYRAGYAGLSRYIGTGTKDGAP